MHKSFGLPLVLALFILLVISDSYCQILVANDKFRGGVCADGFATNQPRDKNPGTLMLQIPGGASIRRVLLMAGHHGFSSRAVILFDGHELILDGSSRVTGGFRSQYGDSASTHLLDITSVFDPSLGVHSVNIPDQYYPSPRYNEFYVLVMYDLAGAPLCEVNFYLNDIDFQRRSSYRFDVPLDIDRNADIGLALITGYVCDAETDRFNISINGVNAGSLDTNDSNSGSCGGPVGSFKYEGGILTGLGDDIADPVFSRNDALSNLRTLLTPQSKFIDVEFEHIPELPESGMSDNSIWGMVLVHQASCETKSHKEILVACPGAAVTLYPSGDTSEYDVKWTAMSDQDTLEGEAPIITIDSSISFIARGISKDGCVIYDSVSVSLKTPTEVGLGDDLNDTIVGIGDSITVRIPLVTSGRVGEDITFKLSLSANWDFLSVLSAKGTEIQIVNSYQANDQYIIECIVRASDELFTGSLELVLYSHVTALSSDTLAIELSFDNPYPCIVLNRSQSRLRISQKDSCGVDLMRSILQNGRIPQMKLVRHGHHLIVTSLHVNDVTWRISDNLGSTLFTDHSTSKIILDLTKLPSGVLWITNSVSSGSLPFLNLK
jgi:hypothetical protein